MHRDYSAIVNRARAHFESLKVEISSTSNRQEYIRITALANEAHGLLNDLLQFESGLVYSHTNNTDEYIAARLMETSNEASTDTPLDLPAFVSPFNSDI